jgi:hypothetical protein
MNALKIFQTRTIMRNFFKKSNTENSAGGWRLAAGGWRLAAGGWRLAAGGWRLAAGGWRLGLSCA